MGSEGLQERVFTRLFEAAEIARFDRKELIEYEDSLKNFRDWFSVVQTAENKGIVKGRAEGLEEGTLKIARNMKKRGIPAEDIMQFTGLSSEEIDGL